MARWGGEEYFIALPGADAATGLGFANDLRRRCEQREVVDKGRAIRCTVSGGVAVFPAAGNTMEELFQAADVAMYEAKNAGRNLVRLHQTDPARPPNTQPPSVADTDASARRSSPQRSRSRQSLRQGSLEP